MVMQYWHGTRHGRSTERVDGQRTIEIRIWETNGQGYFSAGQVIFNGVNGVSLFTA